MNLKELEKHMFKEDVAKIRKAALEGCLQRAFLQLVDVINDTESLVYSCIEAEIEVGKTDSMLWEIHDLILKACKEVGLSLNDINTHRYQYPTEYFDDENTEEFHTNESKKEHKKG